MAVIRWEGSRGERKGCRPTHAPLEKDRARCSMKDAKGEESGVQIRSTGTVRAQVCHNISDEVSVSLF